MQPYIGSEPYIFLSYCHRDKENVLAIADMLIQAGYRVWYDAALSAGELFDDRIAEFIRASSVFIVFLSEHSLKSQYCDMELKYAREKGCICFAIYLEAVDFSRHAGMEMCLRPENNIYKYRVSDEVFRRMLIGSPAISSCRCEDEKERNQLFGIEELREKPQKQNIFYYLISFSMLAGSVYAGWKQTTSNFYRNDNFADSLFVLIHLILLIGGSLLLVHEEKQYTYQATRITVPGLLYLLTVDFNLLIIALRFSNGSTTIQVGVGVIASIVLFLVGVCIGYQKKTLPNDGLNWFVFSMLWMGMVLFMLKRYGYDYRWSAITNLIFDSFLFMASCGIDDADKKHASWHVIAGVMAFLCFVMMFVIAVPGTFHKLLSLLHAY